MDKSASHRDGRGDYWCSPVGSGSAIARRSALYLIHESSLERLGQRMALVAATQQEEDPDLHLSQPFPISSQSFKRKVVRDLTGQTGWKQYGSTIKNAFAGDTWVTAARLGLHKLGPNILIDLVFLLGFSLAGVWYLYFVLWWLPALTWNRFITRIRNIGEHAAVPDDDDRLHNTRTIEAGWWERASIAPYGVNFHLEHHLIVNCPYYKLCSAHEMLLAKGLRGRMEVQSDYASMLRVAVPVS